MKLSKLKNGFHHCVSFVKAVDKHIRIVQFEARMKELCIDNKLEMKAAKHVLAGFRGTARLSNQFSKSESNLNLFRWELAQFRGELGDFVEEGSLLRQDHPYIYARGYD